MIRLPLVLALSAGVAVASAAFAGGLGMVGEFTTAVLIGLALVSWGLTFYVGPFVAIRKSPLARPQRRIVVATRAGALPA